LRRDNLQVLQRPGDLLDPAGKVGGLDKPEQARRIGRCGQPQEVQKSRDVLKKSRQVPSGSRRIGMPVFEMGARLSKRGVVAQPGSVAQPVEMADRDDGRRRILEPGPDQVRHAQEAP